MFLCLGYDQYRVVCWRTVSRRTSGLLVSVRMGSFAGACLREGGKKVKKATQIYSSCERGYLWFCVDDSGILEIQYRDSPCRVPQAVVPTPPFMLEVNRPVVQAQQKPPLAGP